MNKITIKDKTLISYYSNSQLAVIPDGIEVVGADCFYYNLKLSKIVIPKSVKKINANAFFGCYSLCTVEYKGTKEDWQNIEIENYFANPLSFAYRIRFNDNEHYLYNNIYSQKPEFDRLTIPKTDVDLVEEFNMHRLYINTLIAYNNQKNELTKNIEPLLYGTDLQPNKALSIIPKLIQSFENNNINITNEINKYHYLIDNNIDGEVSIKSIDLRFGRLDSILIKNGKSIIKFINPSTIEKPFNDSKIIYEVVSANQIAYICKTFGIENIPDVVIETWLHIPYFSMPYHVKKGDLTERELKYHAKIYSNTFEEYYPNYKDKVRDLL